MLVTGREGQVARSLRERSLVAGHIDAVFCGRPGFDLTDVRTVRTSVLDAKPDIVVSAAAYTAVDQAEDQPETARAINREGAGAVAAAAAELGVPVIHLSTDYVFSGEGDQPHRETDPAEPRCVYGRTKLEGEAAVAAANGQHVILRTAWVYSPFGRNFVKTMLRLARERDDVAVVDDQWGNPTSALDIADAVLHIAATLLAPGPARWGVYHLAGTGATNWSGFARHVLETSRRHGGPWMAVRDIPTASYPTRAERPANSRLDTRRLQEAFGLQLADWQASSSDVVKRLIEEPRDA